MSSNLRVKVGRVYELDDGRVGTCKFIGSTFFKPGEWYGFELAAEYKGKNNGTVAGTNYFKCMAGQGVFVRKKKIVKESSARRGRASTLKATKKKGAVDTGRSNYRKGEDYELPKDNGGFLGERIGKASEEKLTEKKSGCN